MLSRLLSVLFYHPSGMIPVYHGAYHIFRFFTFSNYTDDDIFYAKLAFEPDQNLSVRIGPLRTYYDDGIHEATVRWSDEWRRVYEAEGGSLGAWLWRARGLVH